MKENDSFVEDIMDIVKDTLNFFNEKKENYKDIRSAAYGF
jgi:hypothetical protein